MNILEVEGLRKTYPAFRLRDVSFAVEPGAIMGFIGRNGAGKTTTLKSLLDFVHPDAGEALFFGRPLSADEFGVKQAVGFASGGFGFYPLKRLRTVTDVTRRFYPGGDETAYRRYLALFALDENKRVKELSEGMKVKYALALALSHRARLLVLDEPTAVLTETEAEQFLACVRSVAERGIAFIFISHKLDEVKTYAAMAYTALGCEGLARCDFFVEKDTGRVLINEINTLPGFTPISMYPKLMEHEGIPVPALIDRLIALALERTEKQHG